jgi:hypothetical protein
MSEHVNYVSDVVAIILILIGIYGFFQGMKGPRIDWDNIQVLAEQLPSGNQYIVAVGEQKAAPAKQRTKPKQPVSQEYSEFQQECFEALKGLGTSVKESKFIVNTVFNNHDPKTLQEFINLAFIRGK